MTRTRTLNHTVTLLAQIEVRVTGEVDSGYEAYIPPHNRPELYDPGSQPEAEEVEVWVPGGDEGEDIEITDILRHYYPDEYRSLTEQLVQHAIDHGGLFDPDDGDDE